MGSQKFANGGTAFRYGGVTISTTPLC